LDVKIITICSADRERRRLNRLFVFLRFGFEEGVDFLCFWWVVPVEGRVFGEGGFLKDGK
jgi:hypothetical protein